MKCIRNKWQTNVNGSIKAPRYITWHSRIIVKGLEYQIFHGSSQISQEALLSCSPLPCACIDATVGTPPSGVITLCKVAKRQHSFESSALVHHVLLVVPSSVSCGSLKSAGTRQRSCAREVSETGKSGVSHLCSSFSLKTFSARDETQQFQGSV